MTAARIDTVSADKMVRRARTQARSTADLGVRPSLISSLRRSKNTTKESAVMPTETMKPAMPASERAKPNWSPRMQTDA